MADEQDQFADFTGPAQKDPWSDFYPPSAPPAPKQGISDALMRRFVEPAKEGLLGGGFEGFKETREQEQEFMREAGIYAKPGQPFSAKSALQFLNETILEPQITAAEAFLRAPNAILEGLGAVIGQNVSEALGQSQGEQAMARRDMALMTSIGGLLATATEPYGRAKQPIGMLPKANDFSAASTAIAGKPDPVVGGKLVTLFDDFGVHPAEVVHDARADPQTAASMLSKDPADLPRIYTAGEESEDVKLDKAAGVAPTTVPQPLPQERLQILSDAEISAGLKKIRPGKITSTARAMDQILDDLKAHFQEIEQPWKEVDKTTRDRAIHEMYTNNLNADEAYERAVMQEVYYGTEATEDRGPIGQLAPEQISNVGRPVEAAGGPPEAAGQGLLGGAGGEFGGLGGGEDALTAWRNYLAKTERGAIEPGLGVAAAERAPAGELPELAAPGISGEQEAIHPTLGAEPPPVAAGAAPTARQLPPIGVAGAGEPRANRYFNYDDRSIFAKTFDKVVMGWKETFQPELVSDAALQADPRFAQYKSATAAEKDGIVARAEEQHQFWRKYTDTERIDYMDRVERQAVMPPEWREAAERHRILLDEAAEEEKKYGSKAAYIEDYFPHMWLDPDKVRGFVNTKVAQLGPKWFQKERTFDLIREGLENGLRLKTTNPEDLVTYRLLSGADMRERMSLLRTFEERGLARIVKETPDSDQLARQGWRPIDAPDRQQWILSPDIQPTWDNAVAAKGLWSNEGAIGNVFRGWMAFKNVWVPIKLAVSLFHPLHVLHINYTAGLARAWTQIVKGGDFEGAIQSAVEGFLGPVQAAIPGAPYLGKEARLAWQIPEKERTPEQSAMVKLMNEGGMVPQLSEQLKINARRSLEEAMDKGEWLKAIPAGIRRGIELLQAPIFEKWIPSLKAAAYLNDARALFDRRPELLDDQIQRQAALRTISKSVDNRFGEMFYGGLFWNPYVKDAGIGSFLSLGWNLGFAREFGGALLEPEARLLDRMINGRPSETRATIRDAQNKLPFVISYVATAALINGMMTYGLTGTAPQGLDWMFARVGGTNPDGTPRRIANMFYLREVPMLLKHIQERGGNIATGAADMLWNKLMFQPIKEMMENKDYYGSDIWDENGPVYLQAWQALKHTFADQVSPITVSGAKRALMTGGDWKEAALAMMGFGPAPSYVARDATQNRISYLYQRHVAPFSKGEESGENSRTRMDIRNQILLAQKNNDPDALRRAANQWMEAGGSRLSLSNIIMHVPSDVSLFRALPLEDQTAVMKGATPDEQAQYKPFLKSDLARQAANLTIQAQQQRQAGDNIGAQATDGRLGKLLTDAASNGDIANMGAFRKALAQQLVTRYAPEIAAIRAQPKALRRQYTLPTVGH